MSGRARLASLRALCVVALGWPGLVWLAGEILSGGLGEARSMAAARNVDAAALIGAAQSPPGSAEAEAEIAAAEAVARQALRASPFDSGAIALLGLAAAAGEEPARATALMELVAARAPADLLAQGWLFHRRLVAEDLSGALAHADAMLRADPAMLDRLLPSLEAIAFHPQGTPVLADHLATDPPWRSRFLALLAARSADPLTPFELYSALMAGSLPPSRTELRPYLRRLIEAGLYEQARLLWTQALPAERLAAVGYLANGGFEQEPSGFLFDWSLEPVAGARAEIATIPEGDGIRGLRIQFLDRRVAFRHVRQVLMLMPGRYRLTGQAKAENLRNPRGLHWTLTCADQPERRLGASERVSGTTRWQRFEVAFEVPASGCRAQWLRLELAARIAVERHAAGAAWYDDLAVSRIGDGDEDSCPDEGPVAQPLSAEVALAATGAGDGEGDAQCTCVAPAGTPAELTGVAGDVMVFRGEQAFAAQEQVDLAAGDRVMVRAGGRAVLEQGQCRFDLMPQSVVTLREEACVLCTAVVTTGEVEVAYGQSGGGTAGGTLGGDTAGGTLGGGTAGGFVASPSVTPVASPAASPLSSLILLPAGETRPPASQ